MFDTLEKLIVPADRHKVFLGLEGWMDYFGRYAFDWRKGVFDDQWTVFPRALDLHLEALADLPDNGTEIMFHVRCRHCGRCEPRELISTGASAMPRTRGFGWTYYADGTNAGDGLKETYAPDKVLHWGGWGRTGDQWANLRPEPIAP